MTTTFLKSSDTHHSMFIGHATETHLPEVYESRPVIRVPRSATREYSDSELCTAASMLAKMRRRIDVIDHLKKHPIPLVHNAETALDAAVEKLLNVI